MDEDQRRPDEVKAPIERPSDPRERLRTQGHNQTDNNAHLAGMPKTQRDLFMRLQQRVDNNMSAQFNQDSQGSSVEEGGRTPMADEDCGDLGQGNENDRPSTHAGDEDSDEDLTHVLKRYFIRYCIFIFCFVFIL